MTYASRLLLAAGGTALVLGLSACASGLGYSGSSQNGSGSVSPRDMGQMSTQGTSQGETGTPHTMGGPGTASRPSGMQAPGSSVRPHDMGQMSTHGTSQGETGTPHKH